MQEEVLLFDTEGWEFHRQEARGVLALNLRRGPRLASALVSHSGVDVKLSSGATFAGQELLRMMKSAMFNRQYVYQEHRDLMSASPVLGDPKTHGPYARRRVVCWRAACSWLWRSCSTVEHCRGLNNQYHGPVTLL